MSLDQIIVGPLLDGAPRRALVAGRAEDQDQRAGGSTRYGGKSPITVDAGQVQVEQDDVEAAPFECRQGGRQTDCRLHDEQGGGAGQRGLDSLRIGLVTFDQQH